MMQNFIFLDKGYSDADIRDMAIDPSLTEHGSCSVPDLMSYIQHLPDTGIVDASFLEYFLSPAAYDSLLRDFAPLGGMMSKKDFFNLYFYAVDTYENDAG